MGKPVFEVDLNTPDGKRGRARAVFDTGSHRSLIREDRLPAGATSVPYVPQRELKTAAQGGRLRVVGAEVLTNSAGDRMIEGEALVSPDLSQEMLIGSEMMQAWDISIRNANGHTEVVIGRDHRDPDVQEVD